MAESEGPVPHQALVVLHAVVNRQRPDGTWCPRAVYNDRFLLRVEGETEEECIADLKKRLEVIREAWATEDQKKNEEESSSRPKPTSED